MRHVWRFHQLANRGFSRPFQRFQVIKASSACLHLVAIEATNHVNGSNVHECGRSYGTSVSSDTLKAKKTQRRVSMDERRSMVQNYVNRYREMNAGKFPSMRDIKKNVGGSHYSVRKVLQELIHYSKMPLTDTKDSVLLEKSAVKKAEPCVEKIFHRKKLEHMVPTSKVDIQDDSSKSFKSKEGLESPISYQTDVAKYDGPQSHHLVNESKNSLQSDPENNIKHVTVREDKLNLDGLRPKSELEQSTESYHVVNEPKSSLQSDPEHSIKHETVHEDKLNLAGLQPKSELEQSTESDASERESHRVFSEDVEPAQKYSVWQNLRSFANGILGIWKRS